MAHRFEDLIAWQLSDELRARIVAFTDAAPAVYDHPYASHIRECAASVPSNLAEGFARYSHKQFAHFVRIARASLAETQVRLRDGRDRRYLSEEEHRELSHLAIRAMVATTRLLTYLRTSPDPVLDDDAPGS